MRSSVSFQGSLILHPGVNLDKRILERCGLLTRNATYAISSEQYFTMLLPQNIFVSFADISEGMRPTRTTVSVYLNT